VKVSKVTARCAAAAWVLVCGLVVRTAIAAPTSAVAMVGPLKVTQAELDSHAAEMEQAYRQRAGRELTIDQRLMIRRQALEILVRQKLYRLDAGRAKVSDAEVDAYLKRLPVFNPGGQFSQRAWDNARQNDPAAFNIRSANGAGSRFAFARRLATCVCSAELAIAACDGLVASRVRL